MTSTEFVAALDQLGISLSELARRLRLNRATVWRYAHARTPVPEAIAEVLRLWRDHHQRTGALP